MMTFRRSHLTTVFVLALACGLTACSAEKKPADTGATDTDGHDHAADTTKDAVKDVGGAAKDAAGAMKDTAKDVVADVVAKPQTLCPVSGEELGGMGDPVVVKHGDREIKLCCESCVEDFNKDPAKYIAIVDAATK